MAVSGIGGDLNLNGAISKNNIVIEIPNEVTLRESLSMTVEEYINKYFSDIPVLIEVAKCESRFRQHGKDGKTLIGLVNEFDKGVMQINEQYHMERSRKLGLDIHTLEGNTAYARFLFEKEGLNPWVSSSPCWKKSKAYVDYRTELALNSK